MRELIDKILKFRLTDFLPGKNYLARDFNVIDQTFNLDLEMINTERQLIKILPEMLHNVTEKIHISVNVYEAIKNKNEDWVSQFSNFKYAYLLKNHAENIFKNGAVT